MLKSRPEIKAEAKTAMKQQWGTSIGTLILFFVIIAVGTILGYIPALFGVIGTLIIFATSIFLELPLNVGVSGVFTKVYRKEETNAGEMFSVFSNYYLRKVGGMLWMALFIMLWMFVFIIPGIVKAFSYAMVPFILADCPNVTAKEAIKISMRMMKGHKAELFVLSLSFIGWILLGFLTFGILNIIFTFPYYYTSYAGFYVELKEYSIANGVISAEELA
ncbi:MAG: DUF975 family protein [Firmicutes bacterium]|nr:DUF975 family protein [Bacillota bacterium]